MINLFRRIITYTLKFLFLTRNIMEVVRNYYDYRIKL